MIKVIDSPPGSGKTTWAINYINSLPDNQKVLFVTPYLSECDRIIKSCPDKLFKQPEYRSGSGKKYIHFLKLMEGNRNVVTTHALFTHINDDMIKILKDNDYILIMDEVFGVIEKYDLWEEDYPEYEDEEKDTLTIKNIGGFLDSKIITVGDNSQVIWNNDDENHPIYKYSPIKSLSQRGLLYLLENRLLAWTFPKEIFSNLFKEIYILTFLFDSQIQKYYCSYFDIEYEKYHIENDSLIKTIDYQYQLDWISSIKDLISIEDGSVNKVGFIYNRHHDPLYTSFSKNWYDHNIKKIDDIKDSIINYFNNYHRKEPSSNKMWTVYKYYKKHISNSRVPAKNFLPLNLRATNDYANKSVLAYPVNRYTNPFFNKFFSQKNIEINQDDFALSELIQWVWRSSIRNYQKISIFIPSFRSRSLLNSFLNNETIEKFPPYPDLFL